MLYLLDSNVCIVYINGRSHTVREYLESIPTSDIAVCSVVKTESFYGAMRSNNPLRSLERQQVFFDFFVSLPFDDQAAQVAARIRSHLAILGTPIGSYDVQIASIALTNNLILVTHNTREFSRVDGLKLEDWE